MQTLCLYQFQNGMANRYIQRVIIGTKTHLFHAHTDSLTNSITDLLRNAFALNIRRTTPANSKNERVLFNHYLKISLSWDDSIVSCAAKRHENASIF